MDNSPQSKHPELTRRRPFDDLQHLHDGKPWILATMTSETLVSMEKPSIELEKTSYFCYHDLVVVMTLATKLEKKHD